MGEYGWKNGRMAVCMRSTATDSLRCPVSPYSMYEKYSYRLPEVSSESLQLQTP